MNQRRLDLRASRLLTLPTEPWLSCEDCFRYVDAYVEQVLTGTPGPEWDAMQVHLSGCPACAEEAESLLALVGSDEG